MSEQRPTRLYRIVQTNPPSAADFSSKAQLGIPCPVLDPEVQRRWTGLSLFGSDAEARRVSRRLPMLGSYIAALDIPIGAGMHAEPTSGPGHYSLGASPGGAGTSAVPAEVPVPAFQFEVWELASRSLVETYDDRFDAVDLVRRLIEAGWSPDELVLAAENPGLDVADLPLTVTGAALAARAAAPDSEL